MIYFKFIYLFAILWPINILCMCFGNDVSLMTEYLLEKFDYYKDEWKLRNE